MEWTLVGGGVPMCSSPPAGGTLLRAGPGLSPGVRAVIYADFDGTLFEMRGPKFAGVPAVPRGDVIAALRELARREGAEIVVVSNQKWRLPVGDIQGRLADGARQLLAGGLPLVGVLAALGEDSYRKPLRGMPEHATAHLGEAVRAGLRALVLGDAAGRAGDHSCADRRLAHNIGAHFLTPEELLGAPPAPFEWGGLSPAELEACIVRRGGLPALPPPGGPEVVVLCGLPGAGKSALARALERQGYLRLSADELGGRYEKEALRGVLALQEGGRGVVLDRVHGTRAARAAALDLARKRGLRCRCAYVRAEPAHAEHRMRARALCGEGQYVGQTALRVLRARFEEPGEGEGFNAVVVLEGEVDLDVCTPGFLRAYRTLF